MTTSPPEFEVRIARTAEDVAAAQALRYRVFVQELGGDGPLVDHANGLEKDAFDDYADQLILRDKTRAGHDQVVGVYRLMDSSGAKRAGRFYTENEFDLSALKATGRPLLELGRSCLHIDYRGGAAMLHLWQALAQEVKHRQAEILFGTASFHGTNLNTLAPSLSLLARKHSAPKALSVRAKKYQTMELLTDYDTVSAMKQVPSLIKAYLRLGGVVGEGAYVDHAFNTTDVCLVLDTKAMNARQRAIYGGSQ